mgnify:CR=1 FL=1
MRLAALVALAAAGVATAHADDSKLRKEDVPLQPKQPLRGKDKRCCGYPLAEELGFALRFYWLSLEGDYDDPQNGNVPKSGRVEGAPQNTHVELYTPEGYYFGRVPERLAWSLRQDPRVVVLERQNARSTA